MAKIKIWYTVFDDDTLIYDNPQEMIEELQKQEIGSVVKIYVKEMEQSDFDALPEQETVK